MNNGYRLLNIVASQLLIKVKILLTPLRFVPRCALLLSVVGAYNKGYTVRGSARASPKFFFHFVPEKLRISLTLSEIIKSFLSRRWRDIIWGYFLFFYS